MIAPVPPALLRPIPGAIPLPIEARQWVGWRLAWRDPAWTKPPVDPKTGRKADVQDPMTWGTFWDAWERFLAGDVDGIGFVLTASDPYIGVDFDALDPTTCDLIRMLDSYTEASPSRRGVHVILEGRKPGERCRSDALGVELYDRGRYVTVTGHHVRGTPSLIRRRQEELDALYGRLFPPVQSVPRGTLPAVPDVLERARDAANGDKFAALYDGRWEHLGYPSQSEADLALCRLLAYWTGDDADAIDSLFRESALMRPKWDERRGSLTYGERTMLRAVGHS